eukprot:scaffold291310_cov31-Tisochrysis_lutea.AAC.10
MPTKTPVSEPASCALSNSAQCSASYAPSSSSRCCGSIDRASAGETAKKAASNPSAPWMKPPCFARSPTGPEGKSGSSMGQREVGTSPMPSAAQRARARSAGAPRTPAGRRTLAPANLGAPSPRPLAPASPASGAPLLPWLSPLPSPSAWKCEARSRGVG